MTLKRKIAIIGATVGIIGASTLAVVAVLTNNASVSSTTAKINTGNKNKVAAVDSQTYATVQAKKSVDSIEALYAGQEVNAIAKVNFDAAPVTPPTDPGQPTYTASAPVNCKSGQTYSNLLIDLSKYGTNSGFNLNAVTDVTIKDCKVINGTNFGISINNCKRITVTNTFVSNIGFGLYAQNSVTVKVNGNQWLNMNGINTASLGHAIQFNNVTGAGNQINNNRIENITGVAVHPHDLINVYKSNGLPGDSIQVIGNWIRGGQVTLWPNSNSGAAGIVVGDLGGSYQACRNNILVNPGYVGIQAQGGNHIKVDHNLIYCDGNAIAAVVGMSWGNWSGVPSSDVTYAYNKVTFFSQGWQVKTKPAREDNYGANGNGITLIGNTWAGSNGTGGNKEANLTAAILPTVIITYK